MIVVASAALSPNGNRRPAALRQQLLGVPVGRRHDRRPRAHRVRERAARHLRFVEVRADEDVGRLQVVAQLVGGDVLVAKHDVVANTQPLGLALQRRAVGLAVLADDGGVGRADDEVDEIGASRDHRRQRPDHRFDALARSEQPERQQHAVTGDAERGLELVLVTRRHVGNPVRDDVNLLAPQLVAPREQIGRDLAHHDERAPPWPSSARSFVASRTDSRGPCAR